MRTCFCHLTAVWRLVAEERIAILTQSIHRWKVHLMGYNKFRRWQCGSIFIRLAVIASESETREMSGNSKRIWSYSNSDGYIYAAARKTPGFCSPETLISRCALTSWKVRIVIGVRSRQILFSHCSKPNELIFNAVLYDSVCLKVPHGMFPNATTWKIVTSEVWRHSHVTPLMMLPIDAS